MKSLKTSVSHSFSPTLLATSIWFLSKTKVFLSLQQKNQENLSLVSGFFLHFPTRKTAARSGTALHPQAQGDVHPLRSLSKAKLYLGEAPCPWDLISPMEIGGKPESSDASLEHLLKKIQAVN